MGSRGPSKLIPWPNASHMLANPEWQSFREFYLAYRVAHRLLYCGLIPPAPRPDLAENIPNHKACKIIKIQQVKLSWDTPIEALIVETDVGLDGLPVLGGTGTGTGCGERYLITRAIGANTRVLENIISDSNSDGDLKTERAAIWIQDLISSGPHPMPEAGDYQLGDTGVIVSKPTLSGCKSYSPSSAKDMIFKITRNATLSSHYEVINEIAVPPQPRLDKSDTGLTFYKLTLIIDCVADRDKVYSVFRKQGLWFIRLLWVVLENELCRGQSRMSSHTLGDVKADGEVGGDKRTDHIRMLSPTRPDPANTNSFGAMWKRVFISKIEKRLAHEVMELFFDQLKEDTEFPWNSAHQAPAPAVPQPMESYCRFGDAKVRFVDREKRINGLLYQYGCRGRPNVRYPLRSTSVMRKPVAKGFGVACRLWNCIRGFLV